MRKRIAQKNYLQTEDDGVIYDISERVWGDFGDDSRT